MALAIISQANTNTRSLAAVAILSPVHPTLRLVDKRTHAGSARGAWSRATFALAVGRYWTSPLYAHHAISTCIVLVLGAVIAHFLVLIVGVNTA